MKEEKNLALSCLCGLPTRRFWRRECLGVPELQRREKKEKQNRFAPNTYQGKGA